MLDIIFGRSTQQLLSKTITIAAIIISLYLFLYFFSQFKPVQSLFYGIVFFVIIASGVMSFGNLNLYYNSKGGVIGEITSIFEKNHVTITEEENEIMFDFSNVVLMKNAQGKYSASITSEKIIKLDNNESYFIYVNNEPCTTVKCESKDIYATYNYVFMNREDGEYKVLNDDVMVFYFALYDNYSYLYIEIENGEETSDLWNSYFNKNNFKATISKVQSDFYATQEYKNVRFFSKDSELIKTVILKSKTDYILPKLEHNGFEYKYWSNSNLGYISKVTSISEDLDFFGLDYIPIELSEVDFESNTYELWYSENFLQNKDYAFDYNFSIKNIKLATYLENKKFSKIEINLSSYSHTQLFSEGIAEVGYGKSYENHNLLSITILPDGTIYSDSLFNAMIYVDGSYKTIQYENGLTFNNFSVKDYTLLFNGEFLVKNYQQAFINKYPNIDLLSDIYAGLFTIDSILSIKIYE